MPGYKIELKFNRKNLNNVYWNIVNDFGNRQFKYNKKQCYELIHYPLTFLFLSKKLKTRLISIKGWTPNSYAWFSFNYVERINRLTDRQYFSYIKKVVKHINSYYSMNYKIPKFVKDETI